MTIYITHFDPTTKQVTTPGAPSGFPDLDTVVALMGPPLRRGKRSVTYESLFFTDYLLT